MALVVPAGNGMIPANQLRPTCHRPTEECLWQFLPVGTTRRRVREELLWKNHTYQTYEFVCIIFLMAYEKKEEFGKLNRAQMSTWESCELLNEFVDESDPDLDEPHIEHLLQSAEAIRKDFPDEDWLHLTALIHDLGKVLLHPAFGGEPQWCVVGDTFPLGCAFNEAVVHHEFFKENTDFKNPKFNTKLGIYTENCGPDKVTMSWGHDECMYPVAKENKTTLPAAGLFIVRFHSFYALHGGGAYEYLMTEGDKNMLKWLRVFRKYDLYSKSKVKIDLEGVKPYYLSLIQSEDREGDFRFPFTVLFSQTQVVIGTDFNSKFKCMWWL